MRHFVFSYIKTIFTAFIALCGASYSDAPKGIAINHTIEIGITGPDGNSYTNPQRESMLRVLGGNWIRVTTSVPLNNHLKRIMSLGDITYFRESGQKAFLSLEFSDYSKSKFAIDETSIEYIFNTYSPDIVAIGNEIDNRPKLYDAEKYLRKASQVCEIAHKHHKLCADGALTQKTIYMALLSEAIRRHASKAEIDLYKKALFAELGHAKTQISDSEVMRMYGARAASALKIMKGLKRSGVDYANLHWYERWDASTSGLLPEREQIILLNRSINLLQNTSGLQVLAGEIGMQSHGGDDSIPEAAAKNIICELFDKNVPIVLWWSPNIKEGGHDESYKNLFSSDGILTETGIAIHDAIKSGFNTCTSK